MCIQGADIKCWERPDVAIVVKAPETRLSPLRVWLALPFAVAGLSLMVMGGVLMVVGNFVRGRPRTVRR